MSEQAGSGNPTPEVPPKQVSRRGFLKAAVAAVGGAAVGAGLGSKITELSAAHKPPLPELPPLAQPPEKIKQLVDEISKINSDIVTAEGDELSLAQQRQEKLFTLIDKDPNFARAFFRSRENRPAREKLTAKLKSIAIPEDLKPLVPFVEEEITGFAGKAGKYSVDLSAGDQPTDKLNFVYHFSAPQDPRALVLYTTNEQQIIEPKGSSVSVTGIRLGPVFLANKGGVKLISSKP